eukprot:gene804-3347_t
MEQGATAAGGAAAKKCAAAAGVRSFPPATQAAVDAACPITLKLTRAKVDREDLRIAVREGARAAAWMAARAPVAEGTQAPTRTQTKAAARRARKRRMKEKKTAELDALGPALEDEVLGTERRESSGSAGGSAADSATGSARRLAEQTLEYDVDPLGDTGEASDAACGEGASGSQQSGGEDEWWWDELHLGARVKAVQLSGATHLNGEYGQIVKEPMGREDRWGVRFDKQQYGYKSLRTDNLELFEPAEAPTRHVTPCPVASHETGAANDRRRRRGTSNDPLDALAGPAGAEAAAVMDESPYLHLLILPHLLQMLGLELFFCLAYTG